MAQPRTKTLIGFASLLNIINSLLYAVISFYLVVLVSLFTQLDAFSKTIFSGLFISGGLLTALSIGQWFLSLLSPHRLKAWRWFLWIGFLASLTFFGFWMLELVVFNFFASNSWFWVILTIMYSATPSLLLGIHLWQLHRSTDESVQP